MESRMKGRSFFAVAGITMAGMLVAGCGSSTSPAPAPSVEAPVSAPEGAPVGTSPFPLGIGTTWDFDETLTDPGTGEQKHSKVRWRVEEEHRLGIRVAQSTDGMVTDSFFVEEKPEGIRILEFESQAESKLLFPADLNRESRWDCSKTERGRVTGEEAFTLGDVGHTALRVEFERFYDENWTDDPKWFPDGEMWVVPGIGIVKKDMTGRRRPPRKNSPDEKMTLPIVSWELAGFLGKP